MIMAELHAPLLPAVPPTAPTSAYTDTSWPAACSLAVAAAGSQRTLLNGLHRSQHHHIVVIVMS